MVDHVLGCTLNMSTMMDTWSKEDFSSQDSICIGPASYGESISVGHVYALRPHSVEKKSLEAALICV